MKKQQGECLVCKGRGFRDIRSDDPMGKTKTEPCPKCYPKMKTHIHNVDQMSKIWSTAWQTYLMSSYMFHSSTPEESDFINNHLFYRTIRHSLFRVAVIETAKLIRPDGQPRGSKSKCSNETYPNKPKPTKSNDRFSISNTFHAARDVVDVRDQEMVWREVQERHKLTFSRILTVRDKLYAHSDDEKVDHTGFTYQHLRELLLDIKSLILALNDKLAFGQFNTLIVSASNLEERLETWDDFRILVEAKEQGRNNLFGSSRR